MNFSNSFWRVFHKLFKFRPLVLGCCDCHGTFYLSKNMVIGEMEDDGNNKHPIISCPYCNLKHCLIMVRLTEKTTKIKFEIEEDIQK